MKKIFLALSLLFLFGCGAPASDIVFYYGNGCPHCATVEKYIQDNEIDKKINFDSKEVFENSINAGDYVRKGKICGIDTSRIEVPMLFDGKTCLKGPDNVINFFKKKAGI